MKTILRILVAAALVVFYAIPSSVLAAVNDTLVVYATQESLDKVIGSDTTATGTQAHKVYKLVSRDTTYIFLGAASVKSDITVLGVLGTDGRPPCIQPGVLSDLSIPQTLIDVVGNNAKAYFKNLYITCLSTNGSPGGDLLFTVSGDNVKFYLDNCIIDESRYIVICYTGRWDDFFVTNCKIRNGVNAVGDFYTTQLLSPNLYLPINPTDTVVMKYNTFFCTNGCAGGAPYAHYLEYDHNTLVFSFIGGAPGAYGKGKINNNIFYGAFAGGESKTEFFWMDDPYQPQITGVIAYDTLSLQNGAFFDPADTGKPNARMLIESKRVVEVKDNIYFMPQVIKDFWHSYNDTAHVDSVYTPGWTNPRTTGMFTDKTKWPGFTESGNLVGTDPGYNLASFAGILNGGQGYGVGLLNYARKVRGETLTTEFWGYKKNAVVGDWWIPVWPLPELSANDLKYSAALTAPDGKPYGDPFWFTLKPTGVKQVPYVPGQFNLSNNYPNPFNPSTVIRFEIPTASKVTLKVYNVLGKEVAVLINSENRNAGSHQVTFNAAGMPSGLYFYTLETASGKITKKMTLVK